MKTAFFSKILLILGVFSFLLGPGVALSKVSLDKEDVMIMDGPFGHAMDLEDHASPMTDCKDKDCSECDHAFCKAGGCAQALPTSKGVFSKPSGLGFEACKSMTRAGLERHNLPLPPP